MKEKISHQARLSVQSASTPTVSSYISPSNSVCLLLGSICELTGDMLNQPLRCVPLTGGTEAPLQHHRRLNCSCTDAGRKQHICRVTCVNNSWRPPILLRLFRLLFALLLLTTQVWLWLWLIDRFRAWHIGRRVRVVWSCSSTQEPVRCKRWTRWICVPDGFLWIHFLWSDTFHVTFV